MNARLNINDTVDDAATELLGAVSRPFSEATSMPPSVYKSEMFLERELDSLFRHEWVCIGRADSIKNPGDFITYQLADQPVMVLRDKEGNVQALSNVCLHRMSTLLTGEGCVKHIVCPYHGWTYGLDGKLRGAPLMTQEPGFATSDYVLPQIRCEEWYGWLYITLNQEIDSVKNRLNELGHLIEHFQIENYVSTFRETHVWNTNWKCLAENFMESYHLTVCHSDTVGPYTGLKDINMEPGRPNFNYHWIKKKAELALGNAHPDNKRLEGELRNTTILMAIYPGHFITLTPGYFWYLSLQPYGVDHVHITYGGGLAPEFLADRKADEYKETLKQLLDDVQIEDKGCTERVYRGLQAPTARPGRISSLEKSIYEFAQYIAERTAGFERRF